MKKISFIFLLGAVLLLSSCSGKVYKYSEKNIVAFDLLIENKLAGLYSQALAYDLRSDCGEGHIDGFTCIRNSVEDVLSKDDILDLIRQYNKDAVIILICEDGIESGEIAAALKKEKYTKVHYFLKGYNNYCLIKGDSFTPIQGCGC